uniref:ABC transporter permease n=1 Tax=Fervidobacterium pennivorans TaxID=93466 RepID=A0A7C4W703_FERPE
MKVFRELLKDNRFKIAFVIVLLLCVLSFLTAFSPYDPSQWNVVERSSPPRWLHILGTTSMGQDVFWVLTYAVRNSLLTSLIAGIVSRIIALLVGILAGFKGGLIDRILMFLTDSFLVIPLFVIIVLFAMIAKARMDIINLGILLGAFGWAWDARVVRSQVLSLREQDFTYTSILSGSNTRSIIFKDYIPFLIPLVFSTLIGNMSWAIGMEITLSILGVFNLEIPTLGTMLQWSISSQALFLGYWWWVLTPVVFSILIFVALYLMSVSISEYLDPRMRLQRVGKA